MMVGGMVGEFKGGPISIYGINELMSFEDGDYWICARIDSVDSPACGMFYMSCSFCASGVDVLRNYFYCDKCKNFETYAVERYMFVVNVFDGKGYASLLLLDTVCADLLGKKAHDFVAEAILDGGGDIISVVGREIQSILAEQVVLFKVQLKSEDEVMRNSPYVVTMICNIPHIVGQYTAFGFDDKPMKGDCICDPSLSSRELDDICSVVDIGKVIDIGNSFESMPIGDGEGINNLL